MTIQVVEIIPCNHDDCADLVIEVNGKRLAIEYERPGSHGFKELVEKKAGQGLGCKNSYHR